MTVYTPQTIADPVEELENLAPLVPILYEAFEMATERACQFFENEGKAINAALYAPLVRYHVRECLQDKGQVVEDFDREEIFNNGLCVTFNRRRVRMWKANDDSVPPPGLSLSKRLFLAQQLAWQLEDDPVIVPKRFELNLVILWNVDRNHRLSQLHLVCPKSTSQEGAVVEVYWSQVIPHPAVTPACAQAPEPQETGDLPLQILESNSESAEPAQ